MRLFRGISAAAEATIDGSCQVLGASHILIAVDTGRLLSTLSFAISGIESGLLMYGK